MIEGKNFIFTGLQPWDIAIGSNAKDIAIEVSKHNKVLYVNTPLDKKTYKSNVQSPDFVQRKNVVTHKQPVLRQINPNLWVLDYPFTVWPINFLPDGKLFDWINKLNSKRMYSFVKNIAKLLLFDEYILFIDNDIYRSFYAKEFLSSKLTIYYLRDNMRFIDFWKRHAPRLEPKLIEKCDLVLSNSSYLAEIASINNKNSFNIGQGIDLSSYNADNPIDIDDMKLIPRPIVGYLGNIVSLRLDPDLIYDVAIKNRDFSFVMIGGEDDVFANHKLHTLSNVFFLGKRSPQDVPRYIGAFDICFNPQIVNDTTIGNYPRKIDEYLALGKPVIATKTNTMEMFENYVHLCNLAEEYSSVLASIMKEGVNANRNKRIAFAHTHTWQASVGAMYNAIKKLSNDK